jgi:CBS-domain-containing membrane protein
MNATVRDFMNAKLVYLAEGNRPEVARKFILDFGITAVPVLDSDHKPIGVISLRNLADPRSPEPQVSKPAKTIGVNEPVSAAARALVDGNVHHLVVVAPEGRAVGMISTLDVIRAFLELPPSHPKAFDKVR